jgi:transposase
MSIIFVGVDVSAKTLDLTWLAGEQKARHQVFSNDAEGHRQIIKLLKRIGAVRVALEATGSYYLDFAFALYRAGVPLMVVNPKQSKAFMRARRVGVQCDKTDSHELAQFALRMDFVAWEAPSDHAFEIFKMGRAIGRLSKESTRLKNQIHAESACQETPKILIKILNQTLSLFEKQHAKLTQAALKLLSEEPLWCKRFDQLLTVKGIAQTSALAILSELMVLPTNLSAKQWVKYAGLDPCKKESGTSVKGKTRIAKQGNPRLRAALYMPALSAKRHDPNITHFADRLIANHKTPLQAIVAIQRKILHGIHAMFISNKPWDSTRLVRIQIT